MRPEEPAPPPGPTRREAVAALEAELRARGVESARVEAERLVAHATGTSRAGLALGGEERLDPQQARDLARAVSRRLAGEPLQHIEGTVEFRGTVLACDARALIPRPETEGLVDLVVAWSRRRPRPGGPGPRGGGVRRVRRPGSPAARRSDAGAPLDLVLDIGTGSGAIALALVREGIASRAVGLDVSVDALALAAENRARLGLEAEVELRRCGPSAFDALEAGERFDAVVSNPPYVSVQELATLAPEVRDFEPLPALVAGRDGLDVVRAIVAGAADWLRPGGALFLEIGAAQGPAVRALGEETRRYRSVEVRRDLSGRDRYVVAST